MHFIKMSHFTYFMTVPILQILKFRKTFVHSVILGLQYIFCVFPNVARGIQGGRKIASLGEIAK